MILYIFLRSDDRPIYMFMPINSINSSFQSSQVLETLKGVELLTLRRAVAVSKGVSVECMLVRVNIANSEVLFYHENNIDR